MPSIARSTSAMPTSHEPAQVKAAITTLLASKNVPPTAEWLDTFMPSIRLNTPLIALQKTALFRLLASDLTQSVSPADTACLPAGISSPEVREQRLAGPITVQVLDVEDLGRSRWSQVESIEAQERGETTKGREVVRVVDDETNTDPNATTEGAGSAGPHKLLLQDVKGAKIYGIELEAVSGVSVQMSIGSKLDLRDVVVARGVLLLQPNGVQILGGKVDAWDKKWRGERKETLKRKAGMDESG